MNGVVHSHFHGAFELPSIARPTENSTLTTSRLMRGSAVVGCAQAQFPENGVTSKCTVVAVAGERAQMLNQTNRFSP